MSLFVLPVDLTSVGAGRFELPTSCSRSRRANRAALRPVHRTPQYIDHPRHCQGDLPGGLNSSPPQTASHQHNEPPGVREWPDVAAAGSVDGGDRHRVNAVGGYWEGSVLYLPKARELIFTPGMPIQLEVSAPGYVTKEIAVLPIVMDDFTYGVLELMNLTSGRAFDADDIDTLERVASTLAERLSR